MSSPTHKEKLWLHGICSEYYAVHSERIKRVYGMLECHNERGRLLDIGCGDGKIAKIMRGRTNAKMFGIDTSMELVKKAKNLDINAIRFNFDGKRLPFRNNYFKACFCGEALEHIYDTDNLVKEVRRVLLPGGYFVVTVPNIASWYNRIFLLFGMLPMFVESRSTGTVEGTRRHLFSQFLRSSQIYGHLKAFTKKSVITLLKDNGFVIESVKGSPLINNVAVLDLLEKFFSNFPSFSSNIIVKCRKASF